MKKILIKLLMVLAVIAIIVIIPFMFIMADNRWFLMIPVSATVMFISWFTGKCIETGLDETKFDSEKMRKRFYWCLFMIIVIPVIFVWILFQAVYTVSEFMKDQLDKCLNLLNDFYVERTK
jgi:hypothetical protein